MSYRLSAMIIVERANGEILAVTNRRYGGVCCPGGKKEPGETFEECARRELLEEAGVTSSKLVKLGAMDHPALPQDTNKRRWLCMAFYTRADQLNSKPRQIEAGTIPHWITPTEMMEHDLYPEWYAWAFKLAGLKV